MIQKVISVCPTCHRRAYYAAVLGHKQLDMVRRYAHISPQHTAGVVARMNEKIFGGK